MKWRRATLKIRQRARPFWHHRKKQKKTIGKEKLGPIPFPKTTDALSHKQKLRAKNHNISANLHIASVILGLQTFFCWEFQVHWKEGFSQGQTKESSHTVEEFSNQVHHFNSQAWPGKLHDNWKHQSEAANNLKPVLACLPAHVWEFGCSQIWHDFDLQPKTQTCNTHKIVDELQTSHWMKLEMTSPQRQAFDKMPMHTLCQAILWGFDQTRHCHQKSQGDMARAQKSRLPMSQNIQWKRHFCITNTNKDWEHIRWLFKLWGVFSVLVEMCDSLLRIQNLFFVCRVGDFLKLNRFWPSSFIACCHNSNFTKTAYELLTNESYYFTANIPAIELLDFGSFKVTIVVLVGFDVIQSLHKNIPHVAISIISGSMLVLSELRQPRHSHNAIWRDSVDNWTSNIPYAVPWFVPSNCVFPRSRH